MKYNKLVRDKIPEILRAKGIQPVIHVADQAEYLERLKAKLQEEVDEYLASGSPEELADIQEVVLALSEAIGTTASELEAFREDKARERGIFTERIVLEETKPNAHNRV